MGDDAVHMGPVDAGLDLAGARSHGRARLARLHRVLVDELQEAPEQPLQLPEPQDDRLRAAAEVLYENPADNAAFTTIIGTTPGRYRSGRQGRTPS